MDNPWDWYTPVSTQLVKEWSNIFKEAKSQDSLLFSQSTSSTKFVEKPRLIGILDETSQAFSSAVYSITMVSMIKMTDQEQLHDGDIDTIIMFCM